MPHSQADNRFPGRTAIQPPVPLGAAAGGEKAAPGEGELNKPIPAIDRPAPKSSFAAAVAATSPITARTSPSPKLAANAAAEKNDDKESAGEISEASEKPKATSSLDRALSPKKHWRGMRLKIGVAAAVLAFMVGGYVAWSQFFMSGTPAEGPPADTAEMTQSEEPGRLEPAAGTLDSGDPFDDTSTIDSRSTAVAEPRRMGGDPGDAAPIGRRSGAAERQPKDRLKDSLELDGDESAELVEDTPSHQTPPLKRRIGKPATEPALDDTADSFGGPTATTRRAEGAMPGRGSPAASGSGPRLAAGGGNDDDLTDEKLDGYSIDEKRTAVSAKETAGRTAISIIEAHDDDDGDEKLEGYVPQDVTSRRARSKTLVVRAAEGDSRLANAPDRDYPGARGKASPRSTAFDDEDDFGTGPHDASDGADEPFARPAREDASAPQRRSSPPVATADRRLTATTTAVGIGGQSGGPVADTYRVAPDDNFWKISRKLYGTARYYQALMRYNQDRVPDPQKLRPGMQILTPPAAVLEQRFPDLIERSASGSASSTGAGDRTARRPSFDSPLATDDADDAPTTKIPGSASSGYFYGKSGQPLYRIGPDDTLTGIAQRHLGRASRWQEIYESNQDVLQSPDNLTPGTVIRLPPDASRVSLAPDSDRRR
jgi:nucleoid-associated protein YgaU